MSMRGILMGSAVTLAMAFAACATSGPQKSARWSAYPGCNAKQCATWADGCSAECITEKRMSVTECENKCRAQVADCEASCPG